MRLGLAAVLVAVSLVAAGAAYWFFIMDDEFDVSFPEGAGYIVEVDGIDGVDSATVKAGGTLTFTVKVLHTHDADTLVVKLKDNVLEGTRSGDNFTYVIEKIGNNLDIDIAVTALDKISFRNTIGFLVSSDDEEYLRTGEEYTFSLTALPGYEILGVFVGDEELEDDNKEYTVVAAGDVIIDVKVILTACGCGCLACLQNGVCICDGTGDCDCVCNLVWQLLAGDIDLTEFRLALDGQEKDSVADDPAVMGNHVLYGAITEELNADKTAIERTIKGLAVIDDPVQGYTIIFLPDSNLEMTASLGIGPAVSLFGNATVIIIGANPLGSGYLEGTLIIGGIEFIGDELEFTMVLVDGEPVSVTVVDGEMNVKIEDYDEIFVTGETWYADDPFFLYSLYFAEAIGLEDFEDRLGAKPDMTGTIGGFHKIYGGIVETAPGALIRVITGVAVLDDLGYVNASDPFDYAIIFGPDTVMTMTTTAMGEFPEVTFHGHATITVIGTFTLEGTLTDDSSLMIDGVLYEADGEVTFDLTYDGKVIISNVVGILLVDGDEWEEE
jgi:hypothetical protein